MLSLIISRAYPTCWRRGILNKLKIWKINGRMLGFDENCMSNRTLRVVVENTMSSPMSIENGAVLSVPLFLVVNGHHMQGNRGTDKNPWIRK
jgi:hypothetical protein